MSNLTIKLIDQSLLFNQNIKLLVSDMSVPSKSVPIIIKQQFQSWAPDDFYNEIGKAILRIEFGVLFADLGINPNIMLTQIGHDRIIFRSLWGDMYAFNSFSLLLDEVVLSVVADPHKPRRIVSSVIRNISPVPCNADPGVFLFQEPIDSKKAMVFTGQVITKYIM